MKNAHTSFENASAGTAPSYPNPKSQAGRLLAALLIGQKIDPLSGWRRLGIYRLADTKLQLIRLGWPVQNTGLIVQNRFGECCHVALYALPADAIKDAGWVGEAFAEWATLSKDY